MPTKSENNLNKITIIIDESGTLPDPKDIFIVIAAVGTLFPKRLNDITQKVRKTFRHINQKQSNEIKFYSAGERTKCRYLKVLSQQEVKFFVLVVDKKGQNIPDTPINMAALCFVLLEECLMFYERSIDTVIFDKHFHKKNDEEQFNKVLSILLDRNINFKHGDSMLSTEINAADMVAGCLLWKYGGKDDRFYKMIKDKIIVEKVLNWKEAKRVFLNKIKKLT